jgi:hypothetical protein
MGYVALKGPLFKKHLRTYASSEKGMVRL